MAGLAKVLLLLGGGIALVEFWSRFKRSMPPVSGDLGQPGRDYQASSQGLPAMGPLPPPPAGSWEQIIQLQESRVFRSGNVLAWDGHLVIDADGSPRAYHPDDYGPREGWHDINGLPRTQPYGLDAPENAGHPADPSTGTPANWYGVATDTGQHSGTPIVQGPGDPAPGYWVSTTALADHQYQSGDPRRYVDSERINYISVPPDLQRQGVQLGDLVAVQHGDRVVFAEVADIGPRGKLGEGSIALANSLGFDGNPRSHQTRTGIRTIVFAGSGDRRPLSQDEIDQRAGALYQQLLQGPGGGVA